MLDTVALVLVYLGSALMVVNIYGFYKFTQNMKKQPYWEYGQGILNVPVALLVFFLVGYLVVGFFSNPDIVMGAILFGGSVFVYVVYKLLSIFTARVAESGRLEAELHAVEESNRIKSSFLASVSHEMRTPMNIIIGLDGVALRNPDLQPETREQLEKIGLSAKRLMGLINNILDLNRIETGEFTIKNEKFSLKDTIDQTNAMVGTVCEDKGLTYEVSVQGDLDGAYEGDEALLQSELLNILENAVKYTNAPGTVSLTITIGELVEAAAQNEDDKRDETAHDEAASSDEAPTGASDDASHLVAPPDTIGAPVKGTRTVRFIISDTGEGIDEEFLPKIFEAFTQEDASSTNVHGGSGIGLAVTKSAIDLMGGTIAIESTKGVGTTVTVEIPLLVLDDDEAPEPRPERFVSLEGRRILIVEDHEENAEIVADLLDLEDAVTEHVENGQLAVEAVAQSPENYYDAILMDLRMPVMDGLEATREIRKLERSDAKTIPIIALTANAFESDVRQSLEAGMNEHLAKPTDADMLYTALKREIG